MTIAIYIAAVLAALFLLIVELRRCLMLYQQNSYRDERYRIWLRESSDSTSGRRLSALVFFFLSLSPFSPHIVSVVLIGVFALWSGIAMARAKYKKPLVMTMRASRIFVTACVLVAIIAAIAVILCGNGALLPRLFALSVALLGCYCGSHIIIMAANRILSPLEKHINRKYYNEAASILASMKSLRIIGITGSYGKTSTKHYLHAMLSQQYETLMTWQLQHHLRCRAHCARVS